MGSDAFPSVRADVGPFLPPNRSLIVCSGRPLMRLPPSPSPLKPLSRDAPAASGNCQSSCAGDGSASAALDENERVQRPGRTPARVAVPRLWSAGDTDMARDT